MIKKVKVDDLRPGVFIHDFNRGWFKHPFISNKIRIKNYWMIEKIKEYGITEVYIDTNRGLDIQEHFSLEDWKKFISDSEPVFIDQGIKQESLKNELPRAKEIHNEARRIMVTLAEDVKLGKPLKMEKVSHVVDEVFDSILRNRDALMTLMAFKNKDDYTYMHSVNVAILMTLLAQSDKLPEERVKDLATGGLLHDIGKSGIPFAIINKPGPLSDDERSLMEQHPRLGLEIAKHVEQLSEEILNIIYQHHERLNGTGYPQGLSEGQISWGARAAAICDIYDAVTSDRSYASAMLPTDALKYIFSKGEQGELDFEVVQKFIHAVGIYPVGSLVRLNSGFIAKIVESSKSNPLQPVVCMFYDTNKKRSIPPRNLDLSQGIGELHKIASAEPINKWREKLQEVFAPEKAII